MSFVRFEEANDRLRFDCSDDEYALKSRRSPSRAADWSSWANRWYKLRAPGDNEARPPYEADYPTSSTIVDVWRVEHTLIDEGVSVARDAYHLVNQKGEVMDDSVTESYEDAEHEAAAWNAGEIS